MNIQEAFQKIQEEMKEPITDKARQDATVRLNMLCTFILEVLYEIRDKQMVHNKEMKSKH